MQVGDKIQWNINGCDMFKIEPKIRGISPCGKFVFIEGSDTGLPVEQCRIVKDKLCDQLCEKCGLEYLPHYDAGARYGYVFCMNCGEYTKGGYG